LSVGSYKIGDYTNGRKYCDILLEIEPDNQQALHLRQAIEDKLSRGMCTFILIESLNHILIIFFFIEGLIGIAIIGGVVAIGAAVVGTMMRHRK
jgi:fission 1 protein